MNTIRCLIIAAYCFAFAAATAAQTCGQLGTRANMSVSTAWLSDHLHDPNLQIFAVGSEAEFATGHIPGARPLEYMDTHEMELNGLSLEMPTMQKLEKLFGGLGVSNNSRVVLYRSSDMVSPTTRIYLELDAMGLGAQSSILDGGFEQWAREQRPVSKDAPAAAAPQALKSCPRTADVLATLDEVKSAVKKPGFAIVDAREARYFTGAEKPSGQRKGHIPGAGSLPYEAL
ncbi:MAG TPA: rhodanese-like domain-containing protein, partial [Candidatus Acidoferrales bacterium]|nr:rhodanese-like domain-containing protein [Candidatus Acidoferrales bacterium]